MDVGMKTVTGAGLCKFIFGFQQLALKQFKYRSKRQVKASKNLPEIITRKDWGRNGVRAQLCPHRHMFG